MFSIQKADTMNVIGIVRKLLQSGASRYGYQIERRYDLGEYRLDVLRLLVDRCNPDDPNFFFVQIGANDGEANDQINQMILRHGWHGILLEPQPDVFAKLVKNYKNDPRLIFENAALAPKDGEMPFWTVPGQSGLGSFSKQTLYRSGMTDSHIKETKVATVTAATLLARHNVKRIDLLQVDTEGFDFEVIRMFLESKARPTIINYEHVHLSTPDRQACVALLGSLGYKMLQAGPDRIDTVAFRQLS